MHAGEHSHGCCSVLIEGAERERLVCAGSETAVLQR